MNRTNARAEVTLNVEITLRYRRNQERPTARRFTSYRQVGTLLAFVRLSMMGPNTVLSRRIASISPAWAGRLPSDVRAQNTPFDDSAPGRITHYATNAVLAHAS